MKRYIAKYSIASYLICIENAITGILPIHYTLSLCLDLLQFNYDNIYLKTEYIAQNQLTAYFVNYGNHTCSFLRYKYTNKIFILFDIDPQIILKI